VRSAFDGAISPAAEARYGITPASYTEARKVARTTAGTLFLIPGSQGACLFLAYAVSCGDPGAPGEPMLALIIKPVAGGDSLVGGGITSATASAVTLKAGSRSVRFDSAHGTFAVTEKSDLTGAEEIVFVAD
jgi:hypothetical protein